MRLSARVAVAFLLLVASLVAMAARADVGWRPYVDPIFGYSILYPAALFDGTPAPERGGITLTSPSGARLDLFGGHNPESLSVEAVARQLAGSEGVEQVTYRRLGNKWLVLSGYLAAGIGQSPGRIFYERIALSADGRTLAGFRLVYPASARAVFDPIIATIGNSLQPPVRERLASAAVPLADRGILSAPDLAHQQWCRRQYSSYDPASDSFLRYDGQYVHCVSPGD